MFSCISNQSLACELQGAVLLLPHLLCWSNTATAKEGSITLPSQV